MTYIPGGSGNGGTIATSSDVALSNPSDGDALYFDGSISKWRNRQIDSKEIGYREYINGNWQPRGDIPAGSIMIWVRRSRDTPYPPINTTFFKAGVDVLMDATAPSAPILSNPATNITSSSFNSTWSAVSGAIEYKVQRRAGATSQEWVTVATIQNTGYSHTGLNAGTGYDVRILACNIYGDSTPSNEVSVTTSASTSGVLFVNATMESGNLTGSNGFASTNAFADGRSSFSISNTVAARGSYSARATYSGGPSDNGFARGLNNIKSLSVGPGDSIGAGAYIYLDPGFKASNKYVSLMRLDNYDSNPTNTDHLGISIEGQNYNSGNGNGGMLLGRDQTGSNNRVIISHIKKDSEIPEGVWFFLEMFFTFSATDGSARNRVWFDGALVSDNTVANLYGTFVSTWEWCRYGIVAVNPSVQTGALGLYIDNCYISTGDHLGVPG